VKTVERHHLKENEFAKTVQSASTWVAENRDMTVKVAAAALIVVVLFGGYFLWRKHTNDQAGSWLGIAMAIADAPVVPPPTLPGAKQTPNTYPTEKAKFEAALNAFHEVVTRYPSTSAAMAARVEIASTLLTLNRFAESEQAYQGIVTDAPNSFYAPMAKLGIAEAQAAQGQFDKAIAGFTDLAGQRDGALPVDGILMRLAQTYLRAGKSKDARAAFQQVVDQFPNSPYVTEARQRITQIG
jgi:predicted negative regulator of RcsB-dependent stress response